jgi:hypothetical protein
MADSQSPKSYDFDKILKQSDLAGYFPPGVFHERADLHALKAISYGSNLKEMHEPSFCPATTDQPDSFRLLLAPSFTPAVVVRLTAIAGGWKFIKKQGTYMGKGTVDLGAKTERDLSEPEVKQFVHLLDQVAFWDVLMRDDFNHLDGTRAIIEGRRAGRYHLTDGCYPGGTSYTELVDFLMGL